jgi:alpha-L-fucosidase
MSYVENDNALEYPYPFAVISDRDNICQTWGKSFKNSNFTNIYNTYPEDIKKNIQQNLDNRKCQTINNVNQCFTLNGQMESCTKFESEDPKSIRNIMTQIDKIADSKKGPIIIKLQQFIEKKRTILDNLIENYSTRRNMMNMNQGYKNLTESTVSKNEETKNMLGGEIAKVDELKDSVEGSFKKKRQNISWYTDKNLLFRRILWWLLVILIIVEVLYILSIRLNNGSNNSNNSNNK